MSKQERSQLSFEEAIELAGTVENWRSFDTDYENLWGYFHSNRFLTGAKTSDAYFGQGGEFEVIIKGDVTSLDGRAERVYDREGKKCINGERYSLSVRILDGPAITHFEFNSRRLCDNQHKLVLVKQIFEQMQED